MIGSETGAGLPAAGGTAVQPPAHAKGYISGSALLLVGRGLSVALNFAIQVVLVRYLAKTDYGAFAYGLSFVALGANFSLMGLGKAIPRLVAIYEERGEHARALGAVVLAATSVCALGLSVVGVVHGFQGFVGERFVGDRQMMAVLLVLIAVVPVDALDNLLQQVVAVFSGAWAIVVRRHVLGPGLKLTAVVAVSMTHGTVRQLAWGYLLASTIGIVLYSGVLVRAWKDRGLLHHFRLRGLDLPARELYGFALPLMGSEYAIALRGTVAVIVLGYLGTTTDVANFRAVLPIAGLNMLVFEAFAFLFVPTGSRMFARRDHRGISDLYWQSSAWIAVLTFPVFAMSCALAEPLAVLVLGRSYQGTGTLLAILAVGYYVNAALGFNSATLRVHGKTRIILTNDVTTAVSSIVLNVLLIRSYGALGAAVATSSALILQNALDHAGLLTGGTGVRLADRRVLGIYAVIAGLTVVLAAGRWLLDPPLAVSILAVAACSLAVAGVARGPLGRDVVVPAFVKVPWLRRLVSSAPVPPCTPS